MANRRRNKRGHFVPLHSGEPKARYNLTLTPTAWAALGRLAEAQGVSRSEFVEAYCRKASEHPDARPEAALARRVSELELLFDVIPIPLALAEDADCSRIRGNAVLLRILGAEPGTNFSMTAPGVRPPVTMAREGRPLARHELPMQRAVASGCRVENEELELIRSDGTVLQVIHYAAPLLDQAGQCRGAVAAMLDITEQKRTRQALEASEERLRLAIEAARAGTWDWDIAAGRVYWSPDYCRLYGLDPATAEPGYAAWLACLHPDDREQADGLARQAAAAGTDFEAEFRILHPEGERWIRAVGRTELDVTGQARRMVGIALDVTERSKAQAALAESEERYRSLVRAAAAIVWTTSAEGKFIAPQPAWEDYTGQIWPAYSEMGGMQMIYPEDLPEIAALWQEATKKCTAFEAEYRLWHARSQRYRWCEVRGVPLLDARGAVREWVGTIIDVDERKRLEWEREHLLERERHARTQAEQRERTQRFLAQLERQMRACQTVPALAEVVTAALGMFLQVDRCSWGEWDEQKQLVHILPDYCPGVASIAGTYPLAAFGEALVAAQQRGEAAAVEDVLTDPRTEGVRQVYAALGVRAYLSVPLQHAGRCVATFGVQFASQPRRWTEDEMALMTEVAQRAWLVVENLRLSAQRQEALEREREARLQAEKANRVKDEFLAILSHELRTPLNPIIGWAQMLRRGKIAPAQQDLAFEVIERNAKLQNQLITDLLDVSRIEQGKFHCEMRRIDLLPVVLTAAEAIASLAEAGGVVLETLLPATPVWVWADAIRLQQVVWNLMTNAVKFTPRGGQVQVTLECRNAQAVLSVQDTGSGIAPEFLPYLFERFQQADSTTTRAQGGLGLGLFIVRHIVELHGGRVLASSAGQGKGATFTIELPLLEGAIARSPAPNIS